MYSYKNRAQFCLNRLNTLHSAPKSLNIFQIHLISFKNQTHLYLSFLLYFTSKHQLADAANNIITLLHAHSTACLACCMQNLNEKLIRRTYCTSQQLANLPYYNLVSLATSVTCILSPKLTKNTHVQNRSFTYLIMNHKTCTSSFQSQQLHYSTIRLPIHAFCPSYTAACDLWLCSRCREHIVYWMDQVYQYASSDNFPL